MASLGTLTHVLEVAVRVQAAAENHAASITDTASAAVAVVASPELPAPAG